MSPSHNDRVLLAFSAETMVVTSQVISESPLTEELADPV